MLLPPGYYTVRVTLVDALERTNFSTRVVRIDDLSGGSSPLADVIRAKAMFDKGLANSVKDNDAAYPPEWRLSYRAREVKTETSELERLREQVDSLQRQLRALEQKIAAANRG